MRELDLLSKLVLDTYNFFNLDGLFLEIGHLLDDRRGLAVFLCLVTTLRVGGLGIVYKALTLKEVLLTSWLCGRGNIAFHLTDDWLFVFLILRVGLVQFLKKIEHLNSH